MMNNVHIISRETIKPSSPTPSHQKTHKLSILDQLAPPIYTPIILFYTPPGGNYDHPNSIIKPSVICADHLKNSLSKTLTQFYPFAGRIEDNVSVHCNDQGVTFIEANVRNVAFSYILENPSVDMLQQLLPCNPHEKPSDPTTQPLLAVQINHFSSGEIAVGVCIRHVVADASTLGHFVKTWSEIASGSNVISEKNSVIFDTTSLFPTQTQNSILPFLKIIEKSTVVLPDVEMKRFSFPKSKISSLREKIGVINPDFAKTTRFEAVSSLIWGAILNIFTEKIHIAVIPVNLRNIMNPPLPSRCIGNIYQGARINLLSRKTLNVDFASLAGKIHESIKGMNDAYVREIHGGEGGCLNYLRRKSEELGKGNFGIEVIGLSSWCRFPFYEADFGFGKPVWISTALKLNKVAIFLDMKDGEGMEVWVGLSKEDMVKFEQDPSILTYASFVPSK